MGCPASAGLGQDRGGRWAGQEVQIGRAGGADRQGRRCSGLPVVVESTTTRLTPQKQLLQVARSAQPPTNPHLPSCKRIPQPAPTAPNSLSSCGSASTACTQPHLQPYLQSQLEAQHARRVLGIPEPHIRLPSRVALLPEQVYSLDGPWAGAAGHARERSVVFSGDGGMPGGSTGSPCLQQSTLHLEKRRRSRPTAPKRSNLKPASAYVRASVSVRSTRSSSSCPKGTSAEQSGMPLTHSVRPAKRQLPSPAGEAGT